MSIFNNTDNTPSVGDPQSPASDQPNPLDQLADFKNDLGEPKYTSIDAAVKALKHSQEFIPTLQADKDRLEKEVEALRKQQEQLTNLDDVVSKLTANNEPQATPAKEGLDAQTVAKLVQEQLAQQRADQTQSNNLKEVTGTLESMFGTEANDKFYAKAKELGMSNEQFDALAKSSPKAVLEFFPKQAPAPKVTTGHNTSGFSTSNQSQDGPLAPPEKSILAGASSGDLAAELQRHRDAVYAKYGVES